MTETKIRIAIVLRYLDPASSSPILEARASLGLSEIPNSLLEIFPTIRGCAQTGLSFFDVKKL